jgi:hypothetical protein
MWEGGVLHPDRFCDVSSVGAQCPSHRGQASDDQRLALGPENFLPGPAVVSADDFHPVGAGQFRLEDLADFRREAARGAVISAAELLTYGAGSSGGRGRIEGRGMAVFARGMPYLRSGNAALGVRLATPVPVEVGDTVLPSQPRSARCSCTSPPAGRTTRSRRNSACRRTPSNAASATSSKRSSQRSRRGGRGGDPARYRPDGRITIARKRYSLAGAGRPGRG